MVTFEQIYAALSAEKGHRGRAAARLSMSRRTFQRRLAEANCGPKLARMAVEQGWPPSTDAASKVAAERARERKAERIAGA